ncbi:MAG TPA: histidine phosphatase family protein [Pseudonocardia sp.]|jgi:glucosyl-3-phosphoglycerate phosphatase|nr:histidine phosphatase family protein [Pseudonocardia sp.]
MTLRRLILLRHGQTDYNVDGRMQGHIDSCLTDAGHEQAAEAAPVLASLAPDRLVSSDLRRAVDTAEVVGAACGLPVKFDPRLRETHLGLWQGHTVAEIERDYPGAIATWRSDPGWAPPEGESRIDVVARSRPVVDELDAEFADSDGVSETVLLVAHGGLIAGLVTGLLELPPSAWPSFGGLGNCRWAVLARRDDHPRWRLAGYNIGA